MPTYEYKCKKCDTKFEVSFGGQEISLISCPNCKSMETRKIISLVPVLFRGKGFYKTDHPKSAK